MSEKTKQILWGILIAIAIPFAPLILAIVFVLWIIPAFLGWIFGDIIKSNGGVTN